MPLTKKTLLQLAKGDDVDQIKSDLYEIPSTDAGNVLNDEIVNQHINRIIDQEEIHTIGNSTHRITTFFKEPDYKADGSLLSVVLMHPLADLDVITASAGNPRKRN